MMFTRTVRGGWRLGPAQERYIQAWLSLVQLPHHCALIGRELQSDEEKIFDGPFRHIAWIYLCNLEADFTPGRIEMLLTPALL